MNALRQRVETQAAHVRLGRHKGELIDDYDVCRTPIEHARRLGAGCPGASTWDTCLVRKAVGEDVGEAALPSC